MVKKFSCQALCDRNFHAKPCANEIFMALTVKRRAGSEATGGQRGEKRIVVLGEERSDERRVGASSEATADATGEQQSDGATEERTTSVSFGLTGYRFVLRLFGVRVRVEADVGGDDEQGSAGEAVGVRAAGARRSRPSEPTAVVREVRNVKERS